MLETLPKAKLFHSIVAYDLGIPILNATFMGMSTGLKLDANYPSVKLEVRDFKDVLTMIHDREGVIDLVKMDCEGCENSLLQLE